MEEKEEMMTRKIEEAITTNDLPKIVDLLEDVLILNPRHEFVGQTSLENTLILSAAKACPERVMSFVTKLDRFDPDLAETLFEAGLEEEALKVIQQKGST